MTARANRRYLKTNSTTWMKLRIAHLIGEPICRMCAAAGKITACYGHGLRGQVDHIDGNDANNDPANLQTLCVTCHGKKTAKQAGYRLKIGAAW